MCCKDAASSDHRRTGARVASSIPCDVGTQERPNPQLSPGANVHWKDSGIAQRLRTNETDFDALTTSTTQQPLNTQRQTQDKDNDSRDVMRRPFLEFGLCQRCHRRQPETGWWARSCGLSPVTCVPTVAVRGLREL